MTKASIYINILILLLLSSCKQSEKDVVIEYSQKGKLNGAVLLAKNNVIICDTILGYSDFDRKTPFQKQTSFYIASLAKPITAISIMLLQQNNLLNYNDSACKYIEELPEYAKNVTIKQLLTHTSGIKDYEGILEDKNLTNEQVLNWLKTQSTLNFIPGSKYEYSNSGYIILAKIIETISGKSLDLFLKENIFKPLKMECTFVFKETAVKTVPKAIGFNKDKHLDDYMQLTTGDGGIYSTVGDLYKLDKALREGVLINKENTELMYQQQILSNGNSSEYGFGWFISKSPERIAMHTGGLNGFRSLFWRDLKNDITLIVLTNQGDAFPVNDFLNEMKQTMKK